MGEWGDHYPGPVGAGQTAAASTGVLRSSSSLQLVGGWSFDAAMFEGLRRRLPGGVTAHDWAAFAAQFLEAGDSTGAAAGTWLGWSLGGTLLLEAVARGRLQPRRLVLVATTPRFLAGEGWPGVPRSEWRGLRRAAGRDADQAACGFRRRFSLPDCGELPIGKADAVAGLDWLARVDARELLSRVRVPTEVWLAPDDPLIPFDWVDRLPLSPAVTFRRLPAGGHGAIFHAWDALADTLGAPVRFPARR
jgi:pimeloyl-[acyl-carrier protein] methyl ester esterase